MRLLCWNVLDTNTDTARLGTCLDALAPDIALLQEVNPVHLAPLHDAFDHVAVARDSLFGALESHLVIASKRPLAGVQVHRHHDPPRPYHSPVARRAKLHQFLDTLSAVVEDDRGRRLHLTTLHTTSYAGPGVRADEVAEALRHIPDEGPCIVAGDFNSFAHPAINWAVALPLGFRCGELFLRERAALDRSMAARGFTPSVAGVTFPGFRLRLDQVYRRGVALQRARAVRGTFGSDHRPLIVDLGSAE